MADALLTKEALIKFEEEIKECFVRGEIRAPVHLAGGNEEQLISIFKDIKPDDWVFSTYRSHYHALLKGIPKEALKRQILAGRSMHINSREYKFFTSSIVGGILPIALGVAIANKRMAKKERVWVFIGDMAAETGTAHEVINYAVRHDLHDYLTIVIEDNGFGVNTPTEEVWGGHSLYPALVKRYRYQCVYPHQGAGIFVEFK